MKQHFPILLLLGLSFCCSWEKSTRETAVLSLPFTGRYYNWTQFELKQLNFKIADDQLLIDTTYNLNPLEFQSHLIEPLQNYPAIEIFLNKSASEHLELSKASNKETCNTQLTFYVQPEGGTKIMFKVNDCESPNTGILNSVYQELITLKGKYRSNSR